MAKNFRSIVSAQKARSMLVIPTPTIAQAYSLLVQAVAEADRRGVKSPTIEAIRVLTGKPDA